MANKKQLAILKQGTEAWNGWRAKNPDVKIDLRGANLLNAELSWAQLMRTNLSAADLTGAALFGTNFSGAYVRGAIG